MKDLILVVSDDPRGLDRMMKCLRSVAEDKFSVRGARFSMFETVLPSMDGSDGKIRLVVFDVGDSNLRPISDIIKKMGRDQQVIVIHHDRKAVERMFSLFCHEAHQPRGEHIFSTDLFFERGLLGLAKKTLGLDQPKPEESFVTESDPVSA